jgi:tetratricopeptide (TPR) repeat protein
MKGFQLSVNVGTSGVVPRGSDPTDRFFQVRDIVKELESGVYPPSEWVDRAPSLLGEFFASNPTYGPGSIDRQLDAYQEFLRTHFAREDPFPFNPGIGYIVITKMADLFKRKGEGLAGLERALATLESEVPNAAGVWSATAQFYIRSMNSQSDAERSSYYQKAIETLTLLQTQNNGSYRRKALATLASLYFSERDYTRARGAFEKYLTSDPQSSWAWVAALRIGQSAEALGDWNAASDAYLTAASKYSSVPIARVLGHAYAARAFEALGQFDQALREYQAALAGWDKDYGPAYSLRVTYNPKSREALRAPADPEVANQALAGKIAQMKSSLGVPGGALVERGRWLVEHRRHGEALAPLEQFLTRYRQSPAIPETRYLLHRARLGRALELADGQNTQRDEAAAVIQLDAIARDPYDFGVCAAKIAKASILWKKGDTSEAEALMMAALREWYEHQSQERRRSRNNIQNDIADIRNLVVRPRGDGVLSGFAGNTFSKWRSSVPFVVVNPDVSVKLSNAERATQRVYQPLPGIDQVLFLNAEQQALLTTIIATLDNPTPDRTAPSSDILGLWNKFFPTERQVGGYVVDDYPRIAFETFPIIVDIEFLDTGRTKALARIVVGYEGGTVVLERERGIWTAKALVNTWIS